MRAEAATGASTAVELLHLVMSGPLFLAGLELWQAARTEPVLRAALLPAERRVGAAVRQLLDELFPGPGGRVELEGLLALYRGLAPDQRPAGRRVARPAGPRAVGRPGHPHLSPVSPSTARFGGLRR